ncbi:hypothetical protein QTP86_023497, partial [Hemibagrus guttatus]
FSVQPKDGVGVLNSPLMLHCAVYDTITQTGLPVKWERWRTENGGFAAGVHQMANGSLFFSWLKEEDLGRYVCSARKGSKQIRSVVTVSKAYLENVFFSPQSQSVIKGQDVFFQCVSGDSSPPAHISWMKNSKSFNRGTQIQGQYGGGSQRKTSGTLHLTNITKEDQGHYVCVTHNHLLNISKESGTAILIVGRHSMSLEIMQGPENITVAVEMATTMHCVVRGFPTPKVQWFKDDQVLPNMSRWDLHDDGQLLVFERVLPEDEGFYYCEANNDQERLRSQSAYLLPAVMDWTFVLQPVNKTVRKGDSVTLHCRPPHSRPPAQVSWFRNNQLVQSKSHISVEATGDLLFHSVQETDRGLYFCRASNSFLQRSITSRKIFLEVLAPPSVTIWPLAVISAVGAEVVIQCQVSGHPDPSIEWSKSGQSVRTGGKITKGYTFGFSMVRNATLYISSVRIYDEGFYTCAASNTVGQDEKMIRLRIADNKTLHISNAHQSDAGEYYCTAENNIGQDRRKTTITVFSADPEEDLLSTIPEIKPEDPTNPTNDQNLKSYREHENITNQIMTLFFSQALRGLGGPCRHGERLAIERTYDNKAFEDDNMVAVIEQSPNTSEMRAHPPTSSPSTLLMEPSYNDTQEEVQPSQDMPVIVETHSEPSEEEQLETSFEEGNATPSLPSDVQLQCMEDWRSQDLGQCQRDAPSPPPSNPLGSQEEGLRSSLTLQTSDSSSTPVHHSISLSHASCPLMLSHCVTLGMTSVSVDVHFYPSNPTQYGSLRPQSNSRHEHEQNALSSHHGKS